MRFEIYESPIHEECSGNCTGWEWYWRLRSRNGRIMADGGGYNTRTGCRRAIYTICRAILDRGSVLPIVEVES